MPNDPTSLESPHGNAGADMIGGQRLTHLHATRVSGLPREQTLVR
jgi:hypothetical protein